MSEAQARAILQHPQFGNPEHIEAVRLLEGLEAAGENPVQSYDCPYCGGTGMTICDECDGSGKRSL